MTEPLSATDISEPGREEIRDCISVSVSTELSRWIEFPGKTDYVAHFLFNDYVEDISESDQRLVTELCAATRTYPPGSEVPEPRRLVGSALVSTLTLGDPDNWMSCDAESGDMAALAGTVLHPGDGELLDDLLDLGYPEDGQLILIDNVTVDPLWRGIGIGRIGTKMVLDHLSLGRKGLSALKAMTPGLEGESARKSSERKLAAVWETIGFVPYRDGVCVRAHSANG